jgi:hypothetical protein
VTLQISWCEKVHFNFSATRFATTVMERQGQWGMYNHSWRVWKVSLGCSKLEYSFQTCFSCSLTVTHLWQRKCGTPGDTRSHTIHWLTLIVRPQGKRLLARPRRIWENRIEIRLI